MLFRPEALNAQEQSAWGSVRLVRPLSLRVLAMGCVLAALVLAVFLVQGRYTRKATVQGHLLPQGGLVRLNSPVSATVLSRHAREGEAVRAGQLLFVLTQDVGQPHAPQRQALRRSVDERLDSLREGARQQAALARSESRSLEQRRAQALLEGRRLEQELAVQAQRLTLAQEGLERVRRLKEDYFATSAQWQAQADEVLALQAQEQTLRRQAAAVQREVLRMDGERDALAWREQLRQGEMDRERAGLQREQAHDSVVQRTIEVHAPRDGLLAWAAVQPGESVPADGALGHVMAQGGVLRAHLFAYSRAVGFVRPGQEVRLRVDAYPYAHFGHRLGRVEEVSGAPLSAAELAQLPLAEGARAGEPMYRITVALQPDAASIAAPPLLPGMRVSADVMLEQRRLVQWLFAPLLAVGARW